jgi:hypothetical protein
LRTGLRGRGNAQYQRREDESHRQGPCHAAPTVMSGFGQEYPGSGDTGQGQAGPADGVLFGLADGVT